MHCLRCSSDHVITIRITLHTAERLNFHSCSACGNKWWITPEGYGSPGRVAVGDQRRLSLDEVLARATVRRSA